MKKSETAELAVVPQARDKRGRRVWSGEERAKLLAAYGRSELTQREFAQREGVNYHTLTAWLMRQRATAGPQPQFVELAVPPAQPGRLEVVLPGGLLVRGAEPAALAALIRALGA